MVPSGPITRSIPFERQSLLLLHLFVNLPLMGYVAACRFHTKPVNEAHLNRILFLGFLWMQYQMPPPSELDLD
jgi:hypothetical protein